MSEPEAGKPWYEKLSLAFAGGPTSRNELVELLRSAQRRELLDGEALGIIEGALTVADMKVREIMVPRSRVVMVRIDQHPEAFLPRVISSGHSRFPVVGESHDNVIGILLAKDLLPLALEGKTRRFDLKDILRPCSAVPESKRLNVLLQEFRANRNHLAVVFDEYGGMSGIVTIEDVLEQIVGDIEDEYDLEEEEYISQQADGSFAVKALIPIEDFNKQFGADLPDREYDTIGGFVTNRFGRLPKRGEQISVGRYLFRVINADGRRVHLLKMTLPD